MLAVTSPPALPQRPPALFQPSGSGVSHHIALHLPSRKSATVVLQPTGSDRRQRHPRVCPLASVSRHHGRACTLRSQPSPSQPPSGWLLRIWHPQSSAGLCRGSQQLSDAGMLPRIARSITCRLAFLLLSGIIILQACSIAFRSLRQPLELWRTAHTHRHIQASGAERSHCDVAQACSLRSHTPSSSCPLVRTARIVILHSGRAGICQPSSSSSLQTQIAAA